MEGDLTRVISQNAVCGPRAAQLRIAALVGHALACRQIIAKKVRNSGHSVDYYHRRFARPMAEYRRQLPHFHPDGEYLFVRWRLHGSLPVAPPDIIYATPGQAFAAQDRVPSSGSDSHRREPEVL